MNEYQRRLKEWGRSLGAGLGRVVTNREFDTIHGIARLDHTAVIRFTQYGLPPIKVFVSEPYGEAAARELSLSAERQGYLAAIADVGFGLWYPPACVAVVFCLRCNWGAEELYQDLLDRCVKALPFHPF